MTIKEVLRIAYSKYKLSPLDAEILLSLAAGKSKEFILAHPEKELNSLKLKKFILFAKRRCNGEPVAHITGKKEFFGLEFRVNKNVLIPRPETELLAEYTIQKLKNTNCKIPDAVIDAGTGSGNIIIPIAKSLPGKINKKIKFYAVDISKESLKIAKTNAKNHGVDKKIKFIQSDLLEYFLKNKPKYKNILVLANLPYVSPKIYSKNINYLKCEPKQALYSLEKGLAHYKKLIKQVGLLITDRWSLIFEISPEQKPEISRIFKECLPNGNAKFIKDLAGKWRMAVILSKRR